MAPDMAVIIKGKPPLGNQAAEPSFSSSIWRSIRQWQ
jgi:hypothetical protein